VVKFGSGIVINVAEITFRSHIHVLTAAFLMGLIAAAPIGPVNMMAVRRGVVGGWRHTLACGIGSVFGDLVLFSLALAGGSYLLPRLSSPRAHTVMEAVGALVLLPVGFGFLALAMSDPRKAYRRARRSWGKGSIPSRLIGEAVESAALTMFNPLSMAYWAAVTSSWLPVAYSILGARAAAWGVLAAGAGLLAWFTGLILFVRFVPRNAGSTLFLAANATLGVILLGCGAYCAMLVSRPLLTRFR
jgi:threonine/homoserine/homoserine lactone efflux protein